MKKIIYLSLTLGFALLLFNSNTLAQSTNKLIPKNEKGEAQLAQNKTNTVVFSSGTTIERKNSLEKPLNPAVLEKAIWLKENDPEKYAIFSQSPSNQPYVNAIEEGGN